MQHFFVFNLIRSPLLPSSLSVPFNDPLNSEPPEGIPGDVKEDTLYAKRALLRLMTAVFVYEIMNCERTWWLTLSAGLKIH